MLKPRQIERIVKGFANHRRVQILQLLLGDVRDVACHHLGAEFCLAHVNCVVLNVNGGKAIALHQALGNYNGVFVVIPFPSQKSHQNILSQRERAVIHGRTVGQRLSRGQALAFFDDGDLIKTGRRVGTFKFGKRERVSGSVIAFNHNAPRVHGFGNAVNRRGQEIAGIISRAFLHAGSHQWRLRLDARHGLALHVGAHQSADRVVMFQKRNKRGGDGNNLFGRNIHVFYFINRGG